MTVTEFENIVDNSLCGGYNTEKNINKLLTPCGKTVVTMETCADAEKPVALAYNALLAAKRHIEEREEPKASTTVLIIGATLLGRVSAEHAPNMLAYPNGQVNVFIADSSVKRLMAAEEVCSDVIFWSVDEHEQSLVEKTKSTCKGGADLILDFIGTPRTIQRAIKILNKAGALLIGPDASAKDTINLCTLIAQQSTIGVPDDMKTNEVTTSDHFRLHRLVSYDAFDA
ncbi:hypothetical protein CHS0354_022515 [Potamilus streckersoni]|uniref:Alcohol dehydrogenase-like C-terminal domain-containing protein n=1 Tax=Potamilus streckersoni TaxID=2493646 RepID=A0AAE0VQ18_9BIVA|nr:hypothetical protein CHS0354_022515 [Potamilus streckersoni]